MSLFFDSRPSVQYICRSGASKNNGFIVGGLWDVGIPALGDMADVSSELSVDLRRNVPTYVHALYQGPCFCSYGKSTNDFSTCR